MQRWPVTVLCTPMEEVRESWRDDERPTSPEWAIGNVQNKKMERRNFRIKKNKNKNKRRWPLNRPNSNQRRQDSVIYSRPVRSLRYFSQDDAAAARAKCKKKKKTHAPPLTQQNRRPTRLQRPSIDSGGLRADGLRHLLFPAE